MLTQLTSLSLKSIKKSTQDLHGVSLLTNIQCMCFSLGNLRKLATLGAFVPILTCSTLSVEGPLEDHSPLPLAGMTGLKELDVACTCGTYVWVMLNPLNIVNRITKLTCKRPRYYDRSPNFARLQILI